MNPAGNGLGTYCEPLAGQNFLGIACMANADCRDGLCLAGYCSGPCSTNGDCSQAGKCEPEPITVGGFTATLPVCVVAPCTSTAQCPAGEVCSEIEGVSNTTFAAFCQQEVIGGAAVGAACTTDASCQTDLCLSDMLTCTAVCATASDCAPATGQACIDLGFGGTPPVQGCATACSAPTQCPSGTTCVFTQDINGDQDVFTCGAPRGTGALGADCSTTNNCATGICLTTTSGTTMTEICTQPCSISTDCPSGWSCVQATTTSPSGGTQLLNVCNH